MMRTVKLWLMTALALAIAGLALQEALAQAPDLKPPPAAAQPAPEQQGQEFYVVSAAMMERVAEIINAQRREIERLRAKNGCI